MKTTMNDVGTNEFAFVAALPRRERSRVGQLWHDFGELASTLADKGVFVPQSYAAKLLGVSRTRVCDFVNEGRLEFVTVDDTRFVTARSLRAFAAVERKVGRPVKGEADMARAIEAGMRKGLGQMSGGEVREA
jgi:hypothetical protein